MAKRQIVKIDEDKCDGCGECVPACAEGAIQVVEGKAKLVSDVYCDGLGACLGECPQGAITMEEREAPEFDPEAVRLHMEKSKPAETPGAISSGEGASCPGVAPAAIERCELQELKGEPGEESPEPSRLGNWPVQLQLVPARAPFLDGADLLVAADCVPFACADFHRGFLDGKMLLIGCPKLDSADFYRRKLARIFIQNDIRSIEVAYMEVPCCFGLVHLVHESLKESGKNVPLHLVKIGIRGDVIERKAVEQGGAA